MSWIRKRTDKIPREGTMKYLSKRVLAVVGLGAVIAAGAVTANAAPRPTTPSDYNALPAYRLLDTRTTTPLKAGTPLVVTVGGVDTVPDTASAVTLNLTATEPTASGYL